jgi:DNA-binding transcriptional regulator YhcF (GntR family)
MHPIQEKLLKIYKEENSKFPTFRELAKILGVASTNTVAYHINQLKKRGELNLAKEKKPLSGLISKIF